MMGKFETYMNEQFVGEDPNRRKIGKAIFKALKENCVEKIGYIPQKPMALVQVTEPGSDVLTGIGFSEPDDLLLDNFGAWLSGVIQGNTNEDRILVNTSGGSSSVRCHATNASGTWCAFDHSNFQTKRSLGGFLMIGRGDAGGNPWNPTKADFFLRDPFITSPEQDPIPVLIPSWISVDQEAIVTGLVNNTLLAGTVGECGMFGTWKVGTTTSFANFMISHDKTAVPFGAGANLQVTYTWSLS